MGQKMGQMRGKGHVGSAWHGGAAGSSQPVRQEGSVGRPGPAVSILIKLAAAAAPT
jgi:hypothetical protein